MNQDIKECFDAYGAKTYVDMIGDNDAPGPWSPIYTFADTLASDDSAKVAWAKMADVKHQWLPKVCMADNFDSTWTQYQSAYAATKPQDYISKAQTEVKRRVEAAKKYETSK